MVSNKNAKEIGKILYFDPNDVNFEGDNLSLIFNGIEVSKDVEDLSIAVDLQVINKSRDNIHANKEDFATIGSLKTSNFLKGSNIGNQNVLSTYFTDIKYNMEDTDYQDEALSISSINIEFTSWYVASVIIKFTDVRGSALYSPSEAVYSGENKNAKESIFSSFFKMPYPIFNLKVKGYYGDGVSYPLHLIDFKAEFNSEKGNFDVTAQFIGYTFAILSDIQMAYLLAAPYSVEYGRSYWDEQVKNGRFKTLEGNDLPKLLELAKRIEKGKNAETVIQSSNPIAIESQSITKKYSHIAIIEDLLKDYESSIKKDYSCTSTDNKIVISKRKDGNEPDEKFDKNKNINNKKTEIVKQINQYINKYPNDVVFVQYKDNSYFELKNFNNTNKTGELDLSKIYSSIKDFKAALEAQLITLNNKIDDTIKTSISQIYEMVPSIYNFYKTILAHMETLLHMIAQCAYDISKDTDRGRVSAFEAIDLKSGKFGPFPGYTVNNVEEWIGDYHPNFKEVKLIDSLIIARESFEDEFKKIVSTTGDTFEDTIDNTDSTVSFSQIWYPIHCFDNTITRIGDKNTHPYSNLEKVGFSTSEIYALASTRIATMAALSLGENPTQEMYSSYCSAEYLNIIRGLDNKYDYIERAIAALDMISKNSDYSATNDPMGDYKVLNSYIPLFQENESNYLISRSPVFLKKYQYKVLNAEGVLPLNDFPIEDLKSHITNGRVTSDMKYFYKKLGISDGKLNTTSDPDYIQKYKPINLSIISGKDNCKTIELWYSSIENLITTNKSNDVKLNIHNFYLKKDNFKNSIIDSLSKYQPAMNKILYKKIISESGNEDTVNHIYNLGGFDINDEIGINDTKKQITSEIFSEKNKNYADLYKVYSNKPDFEEANNFNINDVKMFDIIKKGYNIEDLSYPFIGGEVYFQGKMSTDKNPTSGSSVLKTSMNLFGHPLYYLQNNYHITKNAKMAEKVKGYLFLQTLPIKISDTIGNLIKSKRSFSARLLKSEMLLLGSMLWKRKNNVKIINEGTIKTPKHDEYFRVKGLFSVIHNTGDIFKTIDTSDMNYDKCAELSLIQENSKTESELISFFEDWCEDKTKENGEYTMGTWVSISDSFEIKNKSNQFFNYDGFFKIVKSFSENKNVEFILDKLNQNLIKNYSFIEVIDNDYSRKYKDKFKVLGLINRDGSVGVNSVLTLLLDEAVITYVGDGDLQASLSKDKIDNIVTRIKQKLISHKNSLLKSLPENDYNGEDSKSKISLVKSESAKLVAYKYIKTLYDKWISGYSYNNKDSEYKWISTQKTNVNGYDTYDINNFIFVDRAYNRIGHKLMINYDQSLNKIINENQSGTLFSSITSILSSNNFLFLPMPNYQKWAKAEDFAKVFEPLSYSESNMTKNEDNKTKTSTFICMYTGEPSKSLNIKQSDIEEDSFTMKEPPSDFNDAGDGEKVPAFAISYGKKNQSYFKNISLNQSSPATTEASILAVKNLIERSDRGSAVSVLSQDLYTIYSNYSYTCQVEMMGCAQIQPMMYFNLENVPMWNGSYMIYKINHSITPNNMTTNFTGMRMSKTRPKLILPTIVSINDMNTSPISSNFSNQASSVEFNTKIGRNFTLKQYTTKDQNSGDLHYENISFYIIDRLENNLAPIVDFIYDKWKVSDYAKTYGKELFIVNGYIENDKSMHGEGVAVRLKVKNKAGQKIKDANESLFQHIKSNMQNGLIKIDELIKENESCYLSVLNIDNINNTAQARGITYYREPNEHKSNEEIIGTSKREPFKIANNQVNSAFIKYLKDAENGSKVGWRKEEQLWYAYQDTETQKSIAYGLGLIPNSFDSTEMKLLMSGEKIVEYQNKTKGITETVATNEMTAKIINILLDVKNIIENEYGAGSYDKINETYKYVLVDVYYNTGKGGFRKFKNLMKACVDNDKNGVIEHSKRKADGVYLTERHNKLVNFINGSYN